MHTWPRLTFSCADCSFRSGSKLTDRGSLRCNQINNPKFTAKYNFNHILFLKAQAVGPGLGSLVHLDLKCGSAGVGKVCCRFFFQWITSEVLWVSLKWFYWR